MPRVPDSLLDMIVYVYPNLEAARRGDRTGATGFLIVTPFDDGTDAGHIHVVTNRHVVMGCAEPAIRLNKSWGGLEVLAVPQGDWLYHPDGDDVAVAYLDIDPEALAVAVDYITPDDFCTPAITNLRDIGAGDDVYFVGRFGGLIHAEERADRNLAVIRFGSIAHKPVRISQERTGIEQESWLVEARSLSGFSGSPVFVWATDPGGDNLSYLGTGRDSFLLGIDWGHLPDRAVVYEAGPDGRPSGTDQFVELNSGMMCVVPMWTIVRVLNSAELKAKRTRVEARPYDDRRRAASTIDAVEAE